MAELPDVIPLPTKKESKLPDVPIISAIEILEKCPTAKVLKTYEDVFKHSCLGFWEKLGDPWDLYVDYVKKVADDCFDYDIVDGDDIDENSIEFIIAKDKAEKKQTQKLDKFNKIYDDITNVYLKVPGYIKKYIVHFTLKVNPTNYLLLYLAFYGTQYVYEKTNDKCNKDMVMCGGDEICIMSDKDKNKFICYQVGYAT